MLYVWYLDAKFLSWSIARAARERDCRIKKQKKKKEKNWNDSALYKDNKRFIFLFLSLSWIRRGAFVVENFI